MILRFSIPAIAAAAFLAATGGLRAYSTVNFTLSLDASDPGTTFNNFREGGKGTNNVYAIAFNTEVSQIDGTPTSTGKIASFCTELQEGISATNYTFESRVLAEVSAGRAGQSGTASIGIPIGGIGELRAARVRYLFDQHYQSNTISLWTNTVTQPLTQAFQIALWEVTHDSDLSLSLTGGVTYVGTQNTTRSTNAVNIAAGWLTGINANISTAYTSTTWDVWTLISSTGNTATGYGFQDVLWATAFSDPRKATFETMSTAPEPSIPLLGLLALALLNRRSRFCA